MLAIQSLMINEQKALFLSYDVQGNTKITDTTNNSQQFCGFIKLIDEKEDRGDNEIMFVDPTFSNQQDTLQAINLQRKVIMKRLSRLYPKKYRPSLFPPKQTSIFLKTQSRKAPSFFQEIQLFDVTYFKKLFITQQIANNGRYCVAVNKDGRFQVEVVDDLVPVYQEDEESIWSLNTEQPWQLIITKVWAKHLGGYQNILQASPFQFISYFSSPNWNYYNLSLEGQQFLSSYSSTKGQHRKILLKSKNANEVQELGLTSNLLGYQLLDIAYETKSNKKAKIIIKTILPHSWTGKLSIFDKQFQTLFQTYKTQHNFSLSNTLILNQSDFFNLFSSAYIITQNLYPNYENHHQFKVQANCKEASFFQFKIQKQGHFIFSINQPQQNRVPLTNRLSKIKQNKENPTNIQGRYLQLRYMLSRKILSDQHPFENQEGNKVVAKNKGKDSNKISQFKFPQLEYDSIEMAYKKGYNRGEAHSIKIIPGRYVLRVRTQSVTKPSTFTISISSHEYCSISQQKFTKQQSRTFLSDSLISMGHNAPFKNITKNDYQRISFGNLFRTSGYGFVAFISKQQSPYSYVLQIDPQKMRKEGYSLKHEHKNQTKTFSLQSHGDQYVVLILKRLNDGRPEDQYIWPTNCVRVIAKKT